MCPAELKGRGCCNSGDSFQSTDTVVENVFYENMVIPKFMQELCEVLPEVKQDHGKKKRRA